MDKIILFNAVVAVIILFALIDAKDDRIIVNPFEAIKNAIYSEWSRSNCIHAVKQRKDKITFYNETEGEFKQDGNVTFNSSIHYVNEGNDEYKFYNETEGESNKDGNVTFNSSIHYVNEGNDEYKFYNETEGELEKDWDVTFNSSCIFSLKDSNEELQFYNRDKEVLEKKGKVIIKSVCVDMDEIPFSFRLALNTINSLLG